MPRSTAALIHLPIDYYREMRAKEPVAFDPKFGSWNVFRYDEVVRVLSDHGTFSSERGAGAPGLPSIVGMEEPRHRKLRGLVNQAFTPRVVAELAPRVTAVANDLIDRVQGRGQGLREMDVMADFA